MSHPRRTLPQHYPFSRGAMPSRGRRALQGIGAVIKILAFPAVVLSTMWLATCDDNAVRQAQDRVTTLQRENEALARRQRENWVKGTIEGPPALVSNIAAAISSATAAAIRP